MRLRTTKHALAEAVRRWGKSAIVEDQGAKFTSTQEQRDEAFRQERALRERLTAEKGDRKNWTKEEREEVSSLMWASMRFRFKVGRVMMGMFFEVKGEGDSWADAFLNCDHAEALDTERYRKIRAEREAEERAARRKRKVAA